jgi:hypothetical protein
MRRNWDLRAAFRLPGCLWLSDTVSIPPEYKGSRVPDTTKERKGNGPRFAVTVLP